MARCAFERCHKPFAPKRPHQRYCCPEHRFAQRNLERNRAYVPESALAVIKAAMDWYQAAGRFDAEEALREACRAHAREDAT